MFDIHWIVLVGIGSAAAGCWIGYLYGNPIRSLNDHFDEQEEAQRQEIRERGWSARQIAQQMAKKA